MRDQCEGRLYRNEISSRPEFGAKVTEFTFDSKEVVSQPVIDGTSITFMVTDTIKAEELAALVPTIKISDKATITPGKRGSSRFF